MAQNFPSSLNLDRYTLENPPEPMHLMIQKLRISTLGLLILWQGLRWRVFLLKKLPSWSYLVRQKSWVRLVGIVQQVMTLQFFSFYFRNSIKSFTFDTQQYNLLFLPFSCRIISHLLLFYSQSSPELLGLIQQSLVFRKEDKSAVPLPQPSLLVVNYRLDGSTDRQTLLRLDEVILKGLLEDFCLQIVGAFLGLRVLLPLPTVLLSQDKRLLLTFSTGFMFQKRIENYNLFHGLWNRLLEAINMDGQHPPQFQQQSTDMALSNYNLNKLLTRSKQVINEVKKAKLDLTSHPAHNQQSEKKLSRLQHPARKNPIFKLSSSKGFAQNPGKELRINTLPDYLDDGLEIGPDYQTPKFSSAFTVNIANGQKLEDMFSTFGFSKKPKVVEKTEKSIKAKGKENREHSFHRSNRQDVKEKDRERERERDRDERQGREVKEPKKKFLSTLNFGGKKDKNKVSISSRRFL